MLICNCVALANQLMHEFTARNIFDWGILNLSLDSLFPQIGSSQGLGGPPFRRLGRSLRPLLRAPVARSHTLGATKLLRQGIRPLF